MKLKKPMISHKSKSYKTLKRIIKAIYLASFVVQKYLSEEDTVKEGKNTYV